MMSVSRRRAASRARAGAWSMMLVSSSNFRRTLGRVRVGFGARVLSGEGRQPRPRLGQLRVLLYTKYVNFVELRSKGWSKCERMSEAHSAASKEHLALLKASTYLSAAVLAANAREKTLWDELMACQGDVGKKFSDEELSRTRRDWSYAAAKCLRSVELLDKIGSLSRNEQGTSQAERDIETVPEPRSPQGERGFRISGGAAWRAAGGDPHVTSRASSSRAVRAAPEAAA